MLIPKENEVVVKVKAIGVNPVETYIRSGKYARSPSEFPYTPGQDCSGIVESIGNKVTNIKKGDRVYTLRCLTGAYAEYTLADSIYVYPIPSNINYAQAAALPVPYYTAHRALFLKNKLIPGQTILIHGATGAVGIACCQMAKAAGCTVIGTTGSEQGKELLKSYCDEVFFHRSITTNTNITPSSSSLLDNILQYTQGKGVNIIIEMLANENLGLDLRMLSMNGTVIIIGSRGDTMITPRDLMSREATAMGIMLWNSTDNDFLLSSNYIYHGLKNEFLKPIIGTIYNGLEKSSLAHDEVIDHQGGSHGKIIISLEDNNSNNE